MKLNTLIPLVAGLVAPALAFTNSSPHVILSSVASLDSALSSSLQQASSSRDFDDLVNQAIVGCPADTYIFVSQPGLHASDFEDASLTPFLHRVVGNAKSSFVSNHVFSDTERQLPQDALMYLEETCGADQVTVDGHSGKFDTYVDTKPRILQVQLDELTSETGEDREAILKAHDNVLQAVLGKLPSPNYVLVYVSSPSQHLVEEQEEYEFTQQHTREESDEKVKDNLFQKYQFFSPGIFMAIIVSLLLVSVMLFALNWIGSLQISYGAFEKDPELVRQKKQN
ncbi:Protein BIG1 [Yarrowia sp. C11]|nr:Protein BIG1 [Yarrowia sp. E02]KAG5373455.1 Protein BIG1 [Yarrowia sp. C11]